ncbi:hypothetical protein HMPREF7215_0576 [Pyramidobacter piscolens W5455]|uniref:Uncharacterized protein n=1 Tax=Pyramidobacter piscolens W5455 TaxID=352165 RepID=A0ABM9ZUW8_9BACT|nr:hypothetical protein HMPREF7215_0576 [Pyramidobacter piscolens W5455]
MFRGKRTAVASRRGLYGPLSHAFCGVSSAREKACSLFPEGQYEARRYCSIIGRLPEKTETENLKNISSN